MPNADSTYSVQCMLVISWANIFNATNQLRIRWRTQSNMNSENCFSFAWFIKNYQERIEYPASRAYVLCFEYDIMLERNNLDNNSIWKMDYKLLCGDAVEVAVERLTLVLVLVSSLRFFFVWISNILPNCSMLSI